MRLSVTKADFLEALCRFFLLTEKRWQEVEQEARRVAAERKLKENKEQTDELLRVPVGDPRWRSAQRQIDRLFAEHDKLLEIAYPRNAVRP